MKDLSSTQANILIIDDSPVQQIPLLEILRKQRHLVQPVENTASALENVSVAQPHLIFINLHAKSENAYETCTLLRAQDSLSYTPIIFYCNDPEDIDRTLAFQVGASDIIYKPFVTQEIDTRTKIHLAVSRFHEQVDSCARELRIAVSEQLREVSEAQLAMILAMSKLAEFRDEDTGRHLDRVQVFCELIARKLSENEEYSTVIDDEFILNIFHASPLHDIGKVAIPDAILLKPGRLDPDERKIMQTHSACGAETLDAVLKQYPHNAFLRMGAEIARSHHEWWNGSGYPDGLKENEIPLCAQIMAVADVYDALRSERCYKAAIPHDKSVEIITEGRGTQFAPDIVDVFLQLSDELGTIRDMMDDRRGQQSAEAA